MKRLNIEVTVGLFLMLGIASFAYIAIALGDVELFEGRQYELEARFTSASGLKVGAGVEIAGVVIGKVRAISFDNENYEALVTLTLPYGVKIQEDAIASIRSTGLIGSQFIKITPGGADEHLQPGDEIMETEPSVNLEELIGKYIFESK